MISLRSLARPALPVLAALGALFALAAAMPAAAAPGASAWQETEQTALRLLSATETTGGARALRFGLHFKLKPGWHVYWRSPGDAGFPPQPDWSGSLNVERATIHWPAPLRFSILGLETLGYKDEVILPMTVTPKDARRPLRLDGVVRYLTCKDICIPYEATLALAVPDGPAAPSPFAHLISRYQAAVPGDGSGHGLAIEGAETWTAGRDTYLDVTATAVMPFKVPDVYPEGDPVLSFSKPAVTFSDAGRRVLLRLRAFGVQYLDGQPGKTLAGRDLTLTLVDGLRSAEKHLTVTAGTGTADAGAEASMAMILLLAVIGGLILNLMPCVLPVLSIKLLGVVGHGGGEGRTVRLSFLASAAGIVSAFLVLAAALIAVKAGGMTIGWGIQFQQPWFLIAMTMVVTAFACNLWGFFEVRLPAWVSGLGPQGRPVEGMGGHFLQGALATLLATPCSAPFLGTAVGFALARDGAEILAVFTALGLGLALPYLIVAAVPVLATRLPRPGPWMVTLRRLLGLALAATGLWLLSVLAAVVGLEATALVGVLAAAAAGLLYLGRRRPESAGRRTPWLAAAVAVMAILVPVWQPGGPAGTKALAGAGRATGELERLWTAFDEAAIPGLVAAGKTVFVDVTADWCLTCQVNKAFVLGQDTVVAALGGADMVVMQADWTRPDPAIAAYLARHGRYGIPFNAVYGPRAPKGVVLPELLSENAVLAAIAGARDGAKAAAR